MESYLMSSHYDLVTPDGSIEKISFNQDKATAIIGIRDISQAFRGFFIDPSNVLFNLKSALAQIGLHSKTLNISLSLPKRSAEVEIELIAYSSYAKQLLPLLQEGCYIGKLFAKDLSRRVREPEYLMRMFGRCDRYGFPLLSLGHPSGKDELILEKVEGRTIAFLPVQRGVLTYSSSLNNFLPTLLKLLSFRKYPIRELVQLHQTFQKKEPFVEENDILLVKTAPLHIRTVFAKVADELLPPGYYHTSANVLQPDTKASGDIYELFGSSEESLEEIPLEFYTLEPHREYVFFEDRDQLQHKLEDPKSLFKAFETAPKDQNLLANVFVVKGTQLENLSPNDWIVRDPKKHELPGLSHPAMQALLVEKYIEDQPSYPFLKAMEEDLITSQGVLLCRHFPTPLLKRVLLSPITQRFLKRIYFCYPSRSNDEYFSHEDRAFLLDLTKFAISVFWANPRTETLLQYTLKPNKDTGMFVPVPLIETFRKATFLGIYGSNLIAGNFEKELEKLLRGLLEMRKKMGHPLLSHDTPLALLTGGGPGAMEVGNKVAKQVGILSCANIVDFGEVSVINEQKQNPYIDAKMTYRLDRLVERQAEFYLDLPIFLMGGVGTDFEYALEEVRRKTGAAPPTPALLFGSVDYWKEKITPRFHSNLINGTIKGSEWVSNCFYCIQTAEQGLKIYQEYFSETLPIGKNGPVYKEGFCIQLF